MLPLPLIHWASGSWQACRTPLATSRVCHCRLLKMPASASNFLREIIPGFDRLAILFDTTYPAGTREADNVQRSAHQFGLTSVPAGVQRAADIPAAFDAVKGQIDAGYVAETALLDSNRAEIIDLALAAKLPVTAITGDFAEDGALMSYGANIFALYRRASELVDNILRGAKAIFQLNSRLVGATRTSRGCQLQLSERLALKRSSLQNATVIGGAFNITHCGSQDFICVILLSNDDGKTREEKGSRRAQPPFRHHCKHFEIATAKQGSVRAATRASADLRYRPSGACLPHFRLSVCTDQ
jgi:hypothetical protein